MKFSFFLLWVTCVIHAETLLEKRLINGVPFKIEQESYDEYGDKGVTLRFLKENNQSALTLNLKNASGSCSNQGIQESSYEINGSMITFYTHWRRKGRAYDSPIGDRIQKYYVKKNGDISFVWGRVYIEKTRKTFESEKGMNYLFIPAKTEEEKRVLQAYISSVERIFQATFVLGEEKELLYQEVYQALRRQHKKKWH